MCELCGYDDSECYPTGESMEHVIMPKIIKRLDRIEKKLDKLSGCKLVKDAVDKIVAHMPQCNCDFNRRHAYMGYGLYKWICPIHGEMKV